MIAVYVILTHYGTFYTGITNSLIRRWHEHEGGKSRYLGIYIPKEVVHVEFFETRRLAARKERRIKRLGAKKYLVKHGFKWR